MIKLTLPAFETQIEEFDAAVLGTAGVDVFCSSSAWILPAASSLMPEREPWLRRGAHGFAALMRWVHSSGMAVLQPLEAVWDLACPLVGEDADGLASEFALDSRLRAPEWDVMVLSGIPENSPLERALGRELGETFEVRRGERTLRCRIDLTVGVEAWLARRSLNFRRSLRRAQVEAEQIGIAFERFVVTLETVDEAWRRLFAVEVESWKGRAACGLGVPEMQRFYQLMLPRLAVRGAVRLQFARHEERDVGYILGGVLGDTYRGLQFSFRNDYQRVSIGNLAQWAELVRSADEGLVTYDLGSDMDYKRRWADTLSATGALVVTKRP